MKFKSLLFVLLLFCFGHQASNAQGKMTPQEKKDLDEAMANGAVKYSLSAAKTLLEANEVTNIQVKLTIPPKLDENGTVKTLPEEIPMPDAAPYRAASWKILQGGGNLTEVDEFTQSYAAPASAPPNKTMTISVELNPILQKYPKIVLLQTLYFTQNENSFVLNMPEIGANNNKYVSMRGEGAKIPTMQGIDPRAAARMSPDVRAAMAKAQEQMKAAQGQSGINLSAVSSNAIAYYDSKNDLTAVKLSKLALQAKGGKPTGQTTGDVLIEFSFKGKSVGTYSLDDKGTGLGVILTIMPPSGAACGDNSPDGRFFCHGTINITNATDKIISGTVTTTVWTSDGQRLYRGSLYGKFTVNRAN